LTALLSRLSRSVLQVAGLPVLLCCCALLGVRAGPVAAQEPAAQPTPATQTNKTAKPAKAIKQANKPASKQVKARGKSAKAAQAVKPVNKKSRAAPVQGPPYSSRPEVMAFADELATRRGLDAAWVRQTLGQAHLVPAAVRLMQPPTQAFVKNWRVYRSRFIDAHRIEAGLQFWRAHRSALARAENEFGVPAEMIVGIIGVETIYGQDTGNYRVLDALTTLAFDFPASHPRAAERSEFFKKEIEAFLSLQKQTGGDPLAPRGSYAGAMGLPQFMPSSWQRFAVDYDGDGKIDLWHSPADVIGSVANYFKAFGWKPGMPTHYPVSFDTARLDMETLMAPDILPTFSVPSFLAKGAVLEGAAVQHSGPLALVELLNGPDPAQYVAGTENFYVITRYNWSSYYAMAVIELGREVAGKFKAAP
jgi:membrane-bound lytic murein transglycosylase B